jgi:GDP-L-fucose synthase
MNKKNRIYLAGHLGLVGSAIHRRLVAEGYTNLILRSHEELDLINQAAVNDLFAREKPEYVFIASARVGGIHANRTYPAEFIYQNLMIQSNVIHASWLHGVTKCLFFGSTCTYPRLAPQPLKEEYWLTGDLEPTSECYAIAKIGGIKMMQAYRRQYGISAISLIPATLYGPGDDFDLTTSHVLPALIRKFHEAKVSGASKVMVWGTGTPRREFLHVDDLADAVLFLMLHYDEEEIINVGTGEDLTIAELCGIVRDVVGFKGEIVYDTTMPDGTPRKVVDVSRLSKLGWAPKISLPSGLAQTYSWYQAHLSY